MAKKYTPEQQDALVTVHELHVKRVGHKARLKLRLEEMLRAELADMKDAEAEAARHALALGVSKTAIGRAVGTANWNTIQAILEGGE